MIESTQCYLKKDGCILMMLRNIKKNDPNRDKWIAPGGKLEKGESPLECAVRETLEETGLLVSDFKLKAAIYFKSDIYEDEKIYVFTGENFVEEAEPVSFEGKLDWIREEDISGLNLWEGDRLFLEYVLSGREYFEMELVYKGESLEKAFLNGAEIDEQT